MPFLSDKQLSGLRRLENGFLCLLIFASCSFFEEALAEYFPRPEGSHGFVLASLENNDNAGIKLDGAAQESSEVEDMMLGLVGQLNQNYLIGERYFVGGEIMALQYLYKQEGRPYDFELYRPELHWGLVGKRWRLKNYFYHDHMDYGHDDYLFVDHIGLVYEYSINESHFTTVELSGAREDYVDDKSLTADKYSLQISHQISFPAIHEDMNLTIYGEYTESNTTRNIEYNDYISNRMELELHVPFAWKETYADLNYSLAYNDFYGLDPDELKKRNDRIDDQRVALGVGLGDAVAAEFYIARYTISSNIDSEDYEQEIVGLRLIYGF